MVAFRIDAGWLKPVFAVFALAGFTALSGCGGGSGAPNNPFAPPPVQPGPLVVLPGVADVYSGTPSTLSVSGGTAPYRAFSSNSAILPVTQSVSGNTIVLLAGNVPADTTVPVTITVQDAAGLSATSAITVHPAPLLGAGLTITPATPTGGACGGAGTICSGSTAIAAVQVSGVGGAGISGRQVRFDVVSGDFAIETGNPAQPLASTLTVASDQNGRAQVVLLASVSATTQVALVRATDLTTNNQVTGQFIIVQNVNGAAVLSVVPTDHTITGPDTNTCSAGVRVDYYIYGGTPPYRVTSTVPGAASIVNSPVNVAGGAFGVITNGTCVDPLVISILDATGVQTTATLHNLVGTAAPPPTSLVITPGNYGTTAAPVPCTGRTFNFLVTGGTTPYSSIVTPSGTATVTGNTIAVSGLAPAADYTVIVGDAAGQTMQASVHCQ